MVRPCSSGRIWKGGGEENIGDSVGVQEQGAEMNDCAGCVRSAGEEKYLMASVLFGIANEGSGLGIFGVVESLRP